MTEPADVRPSAKQLHRRFLALLLATSIPITAAVLFLGWRAYAEARAEIIQKHIDAQDVRRAGLEQLSGSVRSDVLVLRNYTEKRIAQETGLPEFDGALDWPPHAVDPGPSRGLVIADRGQLTVADRQEISAVEPIFALAQATHLTKPYLRWSYYFSDSRSFVMIYPWAPVDQIIGDNNPSGTLRSFFDYDLYTLGEPAKNAGRVPYWSPVYVDAGGAGLMITHAAPVWVGDQFRGIVASDVLLSYVSTFLSEFPAVSGQVALVDQAGNLIATPLGVELTTSEPTLARSVLGEVSTQSTAGTFVPMAGGLVSSIPISGTPWLLVMTLPDSEIAAAVRQHVWPMLLILAAIVASFGALAVFLARQFVTPAVALAEYGALSPQEADIAGPPNVSGPWKPLADRISGMANSQLALLFQLRAMINGLPVRVVYVDHKLVYRDVNTEFANLVGKPVHDIVGRTVGDILGPSVEAEYRAAAPRMAEGKIAQFDGWIEYKDQGRRHVQVTNMPFTGLGEPAPGFLTFTRDLTAQKLAEAEANQTLAALKSREDLYRSVVVSAIDAIIVMDEQGNTLEFNPAAERIFGYSATEAIGRPVADLVVPKTAQPLHSAGMHRYLNGGEAHVIGKRTEVEARRKDGSTLPIELTVTEVRSETGRIFTSHLRDLTDDRRIAREMQEGRDRLYQVEKLSAMGSLLAGVAHELNNPLAVAVAQSTLLVDLAPDEKTRARAEKIQAAAERCGRIVKSFLAMARRKPAHREPVQIGEVINAALEVVAYGMRSAGIAVEIDLPADLPEINADRDMLGQVFSNLFINAQQAMTGRPVPRLRITARHVGPDLAIKVEDNGPGVSDALRERIFDPYFTTKTIEVGTGIGLSISRNVIDAHGGSIGISASEWGGACFEVTLPVAEIQSRPKDAAVGTTGGRAALRVLIVDDELDVAVSLAEMIGLLGHRSDIVASAAEGLKLLQSNSFDLVFTDLRMPHMDGVAFIKAALHQDSALEGRLVLVTGDTVAGPAHLAGSIPGNVPILEKPFGKESIADVLDRVFGADGAQEP